ncbi:MAG: S41 family peptidase [Candidatus Paceibacterota bacterium]
MSNFLKHYRLPIILILLLALSFGLGLSFGRQQMVSGSSDLVIVNNNLASTSVQIDMEPFWKVWKLLDEKYVDTHKSTSTVMTTDQDRIWGAIAGLTDSLGDPYTIFMPPEEAKEFEEDINGNFEGVGMEIGIKEDVLTVVSPLKGSPAEKAGLLSGDKIIMIDDKPAADLSADQAVKLIRGQSGTAVKISVLRGTSTKTLEFKITRAVIDIPTLKTEVKDDVFVISLYNFYAQADTQFQQALNEFIKSKKHKLILDLRGNPGGYLSSAVNMTSWFLPLGKPIVREDFGDGRPEHVYRSKGYDVFTDNLKMVILVDGGSASASEILAGALQEYGKAKLVGEKTFGKGSVQELVSVTDDTSLKVTVAKWLTPFGKSISDGGLTPDFIVKITDTDLKAKTDPQMEKAVQVLGE